MAENSIIEESCSLRYVHVEILLKQTSSLPEKDIINKTAIWLELEGDKILTDQLITEFDDRILQEHVISILLYYCSKSGLARNQPQVSYYLYRFNSSSPETEENEDEQQISTNWILPTEEFYGLWDSLIFDSDLKSQLLSYVSTALYFSEKDVNPNIISWNRIVLLHGPPGTGKTSLCKALAQKICIRNSSKFKYGQLVEVNTHSLFSKWFSESGKLVTKMFQSILTMLEDPSVLVIVLLDEVETLARSRSSALLGNEPSDALRVVNAMLTHLDKIKRYPNVLILTTSNITDAIDAALIDRADIKQYIGLPSVDAIYQIYFTCIKELQRARIIGELHKVITLDQLNHFLKITTMHHVEPVRSTDISIKLKAIAGKSVGLSGRSLRKIPFIACSTFVENSNITIEVFLDALEKAVEKHFEDVKHIKVPA